MENEPHILFQAVITMTADGPRLTISDTDGRTMAVIDARALKAADMNGVKPAWATIQAACRGYVHQHVPGGQFERAGDTLTATMRLRKPMRYRLDLVCGCSDWRDFPPLSTTAPCAGHPGGPHRGGHRSISRYRDTWTMTEHVMISG